MDYRKASQIRKKSLLSLIAEKKFKEGEGLGSSIGSAISEKLKARSLGFKEKFDPLNMLRAITGEGIIGKSIRTIGGRAMGRSNSDIEYFGGYRRNQKPGRKKLKDKKDPQFTTIGSGSITPLKSGDSIANILGKMYNFMQKTHERSKISNEIEEAFRTEQLAEDERRHKKVIDALLNRKKPKEEKEDSGIESFIEKLLEGLKAMIAPILSVLGSLTSMVMPLLKTLAKTIVSVIAGSADLIVKTLISPLTNLIKGLIGSAFSILMRNLAGPALTLLATPVGAVLAIFAGAAVAGQVIRANQETRMGPEALAAEERGRSAEEDYLNSIGGKDRQLTSEETKKAREISVKSYKETEELTKKFENETLVPAMEKIGFKPISTNDKDREAGLLVFVDKKGKKANPLDYNRAIHGEDWMQKLMMKQITGENITPGEVTERAVKELGNKMEEGIKNSLPEMPSLNINKLMSTPEPKSSVDVISIPPMTEEISIQNSLSPGEQVISMNKTNNFGSRESKVQYGGSTKVRDELPQVSMISVVV